MTGSLDSCNSCRTFRQGVGPRWDGARKARWAGHGVVGLIILLALAWSAPGATFDSRSADAGLRSRLDTPVSITWSDVPRRAALTRFGRSQGFAVMVDRRIDPDARLQLSIDQVPLRQALATISADGHLGVCLLGPVIYFGPPPAAARLRTLVALRTDELRVLAPPRRDRFLVRRPWRWRDLTVPVELLRQLGREAAIDIQGLRRVPYDLWPAIELPPLSLIERLTLVANQFDLTFTIAADGRSVRLIPIDGPVLLERRYRLPHGGRAQAVTLAARLADAHWQVDRGRFVLWARVEDHRRFAAAWTGRPTATSRAGRVGRRPGPEREKRFTLTVKNQPVGTLLRQLASRLHLELHIDHAALATAGNHLDQRVSLAVRNVTIDELLQAVVAPAGLSFMRQGTRVTVGTARP